MCIGLHNDDSMFLLTIFIFVLEFRFTFPAKVFVALVAFNKWEISYFIATLTALDPLSVEIRLFTLKKLI